MIALTEEGVQVAKELKESDLRETILNHFERILTLVGSNKKFTELEGLAQQLIIGVNEAIAFGDVEILSGLEVEVCEAINGY